MIDLPSKAIAALVALTMLSGVVYLVRHDGIVAGRAEVQTKWDADKAEQAKLYNAQLAEAKYTEAKQNAISEKLAKDYQHDVSVLARRLRDNTSTCTVTVSGEPNATAGVSPAAADSITYRQADALADLVQCSKLIEWVKTQGFAQ